MITAVTCGNFKLHQRKIKFFPFSFSFFVETFNKSVFFNGIYRFETFFITVYL